MNRAIAAFAGLVITVASAKASMTGIPGDASERSFSNRQLATRSDAPGKTIQKDIAVFTGDTVIPQFVDGGGWQTSVTVTNLDSKTVRFSVLFFNVLDEFMLLCSN